MENLACTPNTCLHLPRWGIQPSIPEESSPGPDEDSSFARAPGLSRFGLLFTGTDVRKREGLLAGGRGYSTISTRKPWVREAGIRKRSRPWY